MKEMILDIPFSETEVRGAVAKLKEGKAVGPDGLQGERLKFGGNAVVVRLNGMLNAITELEVVPEVLKTGIIVPVYKGGGKDPLKMNSYWGVTLTSVIAKVLESLVLERMQDILIEAGVPQVNQTAYRKMGLLC